MLISMFLVLPVMSMKVAHISINHRESLILYEIETYNKPDGFIYVVLNVRKPLPPIKFRRIQLNMDT